MPKPTFTQDEVAGALSISVRAFRADRPKLEAVGFPRPLPALRAQIWSRAQVEAWIAANGEPADPPDGGAPGNVVPFVAAARDLLAQRYGGRQ